MNEEPELGAASSSELANRVYRIVAKIPLGRVTTYGAIAKAVGKSRGARQIGWLMYAVPSELDLPCHRVVNSVGFLSGGWHFGPPDIMRQRLLDEDVPFRAEYQVDLKRCLWLPREDDDLPPTHEVNDLDPVAGG